MKRGSTMVGVMHIFVWNEHQVAPATLYGDAHFPGRFVVKVAADPNEEVKVHFNAMIYHYDGSSSGGGK